MTNGSTSSGGRPELTPERSEAPAASAPDVQFAVRGAQRTDIPAILDLLSTYPMEVGDGFPPFDRDRAREVVADPAVLKSTAILTMTQADMELVVGGISLRLDRYWWSNERFIGDRWFYVIPGVPRAMGGARMLLETARRAAQRDGLPLVLGTMSGYRTAAQDRLYRRWGFERVGSVFRWRPPS